MTSNEGADLADEQWRLDNEDAALRLARIAEAQRRVDDLREQVTDLTSKLRNARRRLRDAGWDLSALLRLNERICPKRDG